MKSLIELLAEVKSGTLEPEAAQKEVMQSMVCDLGHTRLDTYREHLKGAPETVYCASKTREQILEIAAAMAENGVTNAIFSRIDPETAKEICERYSAEYTQLARTVILNPKTVRLKKGLLVLCAGTSDLPVAEEACVVARAMGSEAELVCDVGVAGLHRLLAKIDAIARANVIVVCAGMEGALASVVGGLTDKPVIAVPTSVGYGASFHGVAALLSMLNSCAPGVSVVNIDNGYGAGFQAALINRLAKERDE